MRGQSLDRRALLLAPAGLALGACQTTGVQAQIVTFSYWFRSEPPLDASQASQELQNGTRDLASLNPNGDKCAYLADFSSAGTIFQLHLFGPTGAPPTSFQLIGDGVSNASGENGCAVVPSQSAIDQNRLASGLELSSPQGIAMNADFEPASCSVALNGVAAPAGFLYRRARLTSFDQATKYTGGRFEFLARPTSLPGRVVIVSGSFAMTGRHFTS